MPELRIQDLGLVPYGEAYALQRELLEAKKRDRARADQLLLLEHPAVYTSGRKSKPEGDLPRFFVERGGEDTYHNPGQLVAYPILGLEGAARDLPAYLRFLESVVQQALQQWGLATEAVPGATGLWVPGGRKVCSIGVAVSGWVTYHGIALNVSNDLRGFSAIHPCGFDAGVMTSLERELGKAPSMPEVKRVFSSAFSALWASFGQSLAPRERGKIEGLQYGQVSR